VINVRRASSSSTTPDIVARRAEVRGVQRAVELHRFGNQREQRGRARRTARTRPAFSSRCRGLVDLEGSTLDGQVDGRRRQSKCGPSTVAYPRRRPAFNSVAYDPLTVTGIVISARNRRQRATSGLTVNRAGRSVQGRETRTFGLGHRDELLAAWHRRRGLQRDHDRHGREDVDRDGRRRASARRCPRRSKAGASRAS